MYYAAQWGPRRQLTVSCWNAEESLIKEARELT